LSQLLRYNQTNAAYVVTSCLADKKRRHRRK